MEATGRYEEKGAHPLLLNIPKPNSFFTQPPAYEDGTDRVFRNVGTQNSDAGE